MSSVRESRKPTTSAGTDSRLRPVSTSHTSPTSASRPVASMIRPIRLITAPAARMKVAPLEGLEDALELRMLRAHRRSSASSTSRARSSFVSMVASTSPAALRTSAPPRETRRSS